MMFIDDKCLIKGNYILIIIIIKIKKNNKKIK